MNVLKLEGLTHTSNSTGAHIRNFWFVYDQKYKFSTWCVVAYAHTHTNIHTVRYGSHKPLAHWLLHTLYCVVSLWQNALDPRGEFKCHLLLAFLTFKRKKKELQSNAKIAKNVSAIQKSSILSEMFFFLFLCSEFSCRMLFEFLVHISSFLKQVNYK